MKGGRWRRVGGDEVGGEGGGGEGVKGRRR